MASILAVVVIVVVAALNVNLGKTEGHLSSIALENIEALAQNEGGSGGSTNCWNNIEGLGGDMQTHKTYCGECKPRLCNKWSNAGTC